MDVLSNQTQMPAAFSPRQFMARIALLGATLGLGAGLWEAGLLYCRPRLSTLHGAEAGQIIWFLAPLVDAAVFGLLGGLFATAGMIPSIRRNSGILVWGLLAGALGAHTAWAYDLTREWIGNLAAIENLTRPAWGFAAGLAVGLIPWRLGGRRVSGLLTGATRPVRIWTRVFPAIVLILIAGLAVLHVRSSAPATSAKAASAGGKRPPNIVLITLDAARADHFSSYGYPRPTTPHMDRLASRGVLFENAIAPSSWTLPSHASILSGLLPHQHGEDVGLPAAAEVWNLPEILRKRGYETAGFNTNTLYGQAVWGLGHGFETYRDYKNSLRYNLALTMAGRILVQPLYQRWVRFDVFCRRNAQDLSEAVLSWHAAKSARPCFLFVHFFEPHDSYLPPHTNDRRVGRMSPELARRVSFGRGLIPERPLTADEQRDVIAAYDNSLAYADEQVGRLLDALAATPESSNTYIILTADHGEAFAEHGAYGHGWTLNREVLHVPLIIAGPGVPSGQRIPRVVRIREIFPTVVELALGERFPFDRASLRRHWNPAFQPEDYDEGAVSELSTGFQLLGRPPILSLITSEWHYIHDAAGRRQLYRWPADPEEKLNLSERPEYQDTVRALHGRLAGHLGSSVRPWRAPQYLTALDRPGFSFLREMAFHPPAGEGPPAAQPRIGMSQAQFSPDTSAPPGQPVRSDEDLLRTLPYP